MKFTEENENSNAAAAQPGIQNQPGKNGDKDGNVATPSKNPVTNSAEEISAGINEEDIDSIDIEEPTEEELDEQRNNERDAMNDDSYVPSADKKRK